MVQSIDGRNLTEVVYKTCPRCKISKPATLDFFHSDQQQNSGLRTYCKVCQKKYYFNNRKNIRLQQREQRKQMKAKAIEYLGGQCQCCGFKKALSVLQFHHRDPTEKEAMWNTIKNWPEEKRKKELDKCDLLCANCHNAFHASDVIYDENGYTWKVDHPNYASMAESVDAPDLKSVDL